MLSSYQTTHSCLLQKIESWLKLGLSRCLKIDCTKPVRECRYDDIGALPQVLRDTFSDLNLESWSKSKNSFLFWLKALIFPFLNSFHIKSHTYVTTCYLGTFRHFVFASKTCWWTCYVSDQINRRSCPDALASATRLVACRFIYHLNKVFPSAFLFFSIMRPFSDTTTHTPASSSSVYITTKPKP